MLLPELLLPESLLPGPLLPELPLEGEVAEVATELQNPSNVCPCVPRRTLSRDELDDTRRWRKRLPKYMARHSGGHDDDEYNSRHNDYSYIEY
jgi:hypothetical protein